MPDLPEVDSYRTGLSKIVKGWEIKSGRAIWKRAAESDFERIKNQKIEGLDRRGKYLIINLIFFIIDLRVIVKTLIISKNQD